MVGEGTGHATMIEFLSFVFLFLRSINCHGTITYNAAQSSFTYDTSNGVSFTSYVKFENRYFRAKPLKVLQVHEKACHLRCIRHKCVSYNVGQQRCELFDKHLYDAPQNLTKSTDFDYFAIEVRWKFYDY